MSRSVFVLALTLAACVQDRDAGDPFKPVVDGSVPNSPWQPDPNAGLEPEPAAAAEASDGEAAGEGSATGSEAAPAAPEAAAAPSDPSGLDPALVLQAKALGVPLESLAPPPVDPVAAPVAGDPAAAAAEAAALLSGFGVRLVSTLVDTQPPRAILGMPDGTERVVQAGDLLPEQRLVILAIGRDAAHVAKITPDGDRATIEPSMLVPMYRGSAPTAP